MSLIAVCPSGLSGEIRGVKGGDLRALAKSTNPLKEALERCWVKTAADGPYVIHDGVQPRWNEVLAGDIFHSLLQVYKAGFGPEFDFEFQCEDPSCRKRNHAPQTATINLDTTVEVRPLSERGLAGFKDGNRFTCTIAGKSVVFRLATGATLFDDPGAEVSDDPLDGVISAIISVEGVADKQAWIDDLDGADIAELIEEMAAVSCGPNLLHQVQCQRCWSVQRVRLPLAQAFRLRRRPTPR